MVSKGRLVGAARQLGTASAGERGRIARELARARFVPAGHKPLQLPGGHQPTWWGEALAVAESHEGGDGGALLNVLLDPLRCYECRTDGDDERSIALLSSVTTSAGPQLLIATLTTATRNGIPTESGVLDLEVVDLASDEAVFSRLARLAGLLTESSLRAPDPDGKPPVLLAVGALTDAEILQLRCDLWARAARLDAVLAQPVQRTAQTAQRLRGFRGDVVFVAHARCGAALGHVLAAVPPAAARVDLLESEREELEAEWRIWAEELISERAASPVEAEHVGGEALTWAEGAPRVEEREGDHFTLSSRARKQVKGSNPYPHVDRMITALNTLADVATAWAQKDGSLGERFEDWASRDFGLQVSMHDEELTKRSMDTFQHGDRTYSREPHVKVDDGVAFSECGRIYFALDHASRRVIVDHVGLHLYRRRDW